MLKLTLSLVLTFFVASVFAQKDTVILHLAHRKIKKVAIIRPPEVIYALFGGSGPEYSINYDRRFKRRTNGLGATIGLGFAQTGGDSLRTSQGNVGLPSKTVISLPISINYLIGNHNDFLEVAGGATFATAPVNIWEVHELNKPTVIFHVSLGIRHQPLMGGLFYRLGVCPLYSTLESGINYYFGLGYNFKRATR
jgi:hypothetical protein